MLPKVHFDAPTKRVVEHFGNRAIVLAVPDRFANETVGHRKDFVGIVAQVA